MKKICVIGSLNMDLIAYVDRFPEPGETVTGRDFDVSPGGKGANQAVAAARLGADVIMVGCLGDDIYGLNYMNVLSENNVNIAGINVVPNVSSGIALIEVDCQGENNIVIISGSNELVNSEYINEKWDLISDADIILMQLEIPVDTVVYAAKRLKKLGKIIILDPAPATDIPSELYELVDYFTPNETELAYYSGIKVRDEADFEEAAKKLFYKGLNVVIAKAGNKGAYIISKEISEHIPAFSVDVVDTTAAGDSFNAGLAFALARGFSIEKSVLIANAVGALSITGAGAQGAMPNLNELKSFIMKNGFSAEGL